MRLKTFFDRQLEVWDDARTRFQELTNVQVRDIKCGANTVKVQWNPCFLSAENRPEAQIVKTIDNQFELLINPFPILPMHFTIPARHHQPQQIDGNYGEIHRILTEFSDIMVFYNGPKCGASAPDHLHFQAGTSGILPLQIDWQRLNTRAEILVSLNDNEYIAAIRDFVCPAFCIRSRSEENDVAMFRMLYAVLPKHKDDIEPMMNIVSWRIGDDFISVVFPRRSHRPACYDAVGDAQLLVSPGAVDMAGLLILPREEDFLRITPEAVHQIYTDVSMSFAEQLTVSCRLKDRYLQGNLRLFATPFVHEPSVKNCTSRSISHIQ